MWNRIISNSFPYGLFTAIIIAVSIAVFTTDLTLAQANPETRPLVLTDKDGKILGAKQGMPIIQAPTSQLNGAAYSLMANPVEDAGNEVIIRVSPSDSSSLLLNIQDGQPVFSAVPADWWSGQWILERQEDGHGRLISRWKKGLALGVDSSGKLTAMRRDDPATLWQIAIDSSIVPAEAVAEADHSLAEPEKGIMAKVVEVVPEPAGLERSKSATIQTENNQPENKKPQISELTVNDKRNSEALSEPTDMSRNLLLVSGDAKFLVDSNLLLLPVIEDPRPQMLRPQEIETGIFRFVAKMGETDAILNIQNGTLELAAVDPEWWSGQWVTEQTGDNAVIIRNRWKPEILLGRDASQRLKVMQGGEAGNDQLWRLITPDKLGKQEQVAGIQVPAPAAKKVKVGPAAIKRKPAPSPREKKPNEMARPVPKAKAPVAAESKETTANVNRPIFERIHGEFVLNNTNTYSVGPWQTYMKLHATDLFGAGETIWILGDLFQWGDELSALRAGFHLPLGKSNQWHLRYTAHLSSIDPFPVDRDYQWLRIKELEQQIEIYRVSATEGHRNETGAFLNILDSDQEKLELGETRPRDLGFSSRDLGFFTGGNFWRENESTKESGDYQFSVSAGINALNASTRIAARQEAEAFPFVVKGRASFTREWKSSGIYSKASAAFQFADRVTEWHKHFTLGGQGFVVGYPAAEAAGEIGAAASFEIGRRLPSQALSQMIGNEVFLTPYVRGDIGFTDSLYDAQSNKTEYARDTMLLSVAAGIRIGTDKTRFDLGYGIPISGKSRFDNSQSGRFMFSASTSW